MGLFSNLIIPSDRIQKLEDKYQEFLDTYGYDYEKHIRMNKDIDWWEAREEYRKEFDIVPVVGTQYYNGDEKLLKLFKSKGGEIEEKEHMVVKIGLVPEKKNKVDKNAIKVMSVYPAPPGRLGDTNYKIGYIPSEWAAKLRLPKPQEVEAELFVYNNKVYANICLLQLAKYYR